MNRSNSSASDAMPIKVNAAGFNAYLISDTSAKMVYVCAIIRSGYYNESPDATDHESGINHLFEHVLLNAWRKCNKKQCALFWNNRSAVYNGSTHMQYVEYHITGLDSETADMVDFITQIIANPHFDAKIIEAEKAAVFNELKIIQNNPVHKLTHALYSCVYSDRSGMRNETNIQMQIDNLKRITVADIIAYHKRYYTSENTTFFFAGNITKSAVIGALNRNMARRGRGDHHQRCSAVIIDSNKVLIPSFRATGSSGNGKGSKSSGRGSKGSGSGNAPPTFPIFIENPEAKNTTFTIILPVFQPNPPDIANTHQFYFFGGIMGVELNSLLRTKNKLVYGVGVQSYASTNGNIIIITGSCIDKNVRRILNMCLHYIVEHQHPKHLVPEKIIHAEKGRVAMNEYGQMRTAIQTAAYYQSFFAEYARMNGSIPLAELDVPFIGPKQWLRDTESISALDVQKMFQSVDVSKAVYGYIGKHKQ